MASTLHLYFDRKKLTNFNRDYDQVRADLGSAKHLSQYKKTKSIEDLPGLGQHYCVECAKWFESEYNLNAHRMGKNHKRRYDQPRLTCSLSLSLSHHFPANSN